MELITSRENLKIKQIAKLISSKSERRATNLFVAEGARLCADALKSGIAVREIFFTEKALEKYEEARVLAGHSAARAYRVSDGVAEKISDTKSPQGVFALCETPALKRPPIHVKNARYLLLSAIQDPGNMGSMIRTAEAFGIHGVCVCGDCAELHSPKVLRASMGGVFRVPLWSVSDMRAEIAGLRAGGVKIFAAALKNEAGSLDGMRFLDSCAVLLGNEGAGLSENLVAACDATVKIPMEGGAESLGVAAAAGIFIWEMTRK